MFLWGREVLSIIKSLSRTQKRNIMLFVDAMLVPLALLFSFSLHASDSGAFGMMLAYLPVLPFLLIIGGALSFLLGVSTIQLNAYETVTF